MGNIRHPQVQRPTEAALLLHREHQPELAPRHLLLVHLHSSYMDCRLHARQLCTRGSVYDKLAGGVDVHRLLHLQARVGARRALRPCRRRQRGDACACRSQRHGDVGDRQAHQHAVRQRPHFPQPQPQGV